MMKKLYLDLETVDIKHQGRNYKFPIQCGIYDGGKLQKDWWFALPKESKVIFKWSKETWKDYQKANREEMLNIEETIKVLQAFVDDGFIISGWNVKAFDTYHLGKWGLETPINQIGDSFVALKRFRKKYPKRLKGLKNNNPIWTVIGALRIDRFRVSVRR